MSLDDALDDRAGGACELCGAEAGLTVLALPHAPTADVDGSVLLCGQCHAAADDRAPLVGQHWFALRESAWSEVVPVQVLSWQLLHRVEAPWAAELRDQVWMDDAVRAWAEAGLESDETLVVVDCNGTALADGDSVTLIKDLAVKGAGFTAKRGTMVRNIRLIDDPTHIEGKVNGTAIYLKTAFLKRA